MSSLDWRKAKISTKRSLSTADEAEYRSRDAAARWLDENARKTSNVRPSKKDRKSLGRARSTHPEGAEQ